jgi:ubiquitin-protein ligase
VYVQEESISEWNVFIEGQGLYRGRWWPLTVGFGPEYPQKPPSLRFSIVPYHMNVSEDGRVCIKEVTTAYTRMTVVREILVAVRDLFTNPQPAFAVQIEKWWNARRAPVEYEAAAAQSCEDAYSTLEDALRGIEILGPAAAPPARGGTSFGSLGLTGSVGFLRRDEGDLLDILDEESDF